MRGMGIYPWQQRCEHCDVYDPFERTGLAPHPAEIKYDVEKYVGYENALYIPHYAEYGAVFVGGVVESEMRREASETYEGSYQCQYIQYVRGQPYPWGKPYGGL